jgi:hypothetical protein
VCQFFVLLSAVPFTPTAQCCEGGQHLVVTLHSFTGRNARRSVVLSPFCINDVKASVSEFPNV